MRKEKTKRIEEEKLLLLQRFFEALIELVDVITFFVSSSNAQCKQKPKKTSAIQSLSLESRNFFSWEPKRIKMIPNT